MAPPTDCSTRAAINVPAPKVYETLDSGAADAVAMPAEGRMSFKLTEVAPHYYEMPGGLYRGAFVLIMNQDTFDALPADVQKALEDNVFGEPHQDARRRDAQQCADQLRNNECGRVGGRNA